MGKVSWVDCSICSKMLTMCFLLIFFFESYGQKKNNAGTASSYTEVERGAANITGSYKVIEGSFTGYNIDRYNNRPLKKI